MILYDKIATISSHSNDIQGVMCLVLHYCQDSTLSVITGHTACTDYMTHIMFVGTSMGCTFTCLVFTYVHYY